MANPQKENGYTPIANEIMDQIVRLPLNGTQLRMLLIIWRYTYGFSRKEHEISETFISKASGIDRRNIRREISELIKKKMLIVVQEASFTRPRVIRFNKNYDNWEGVNLPSEGENTPGGQDATPPEGELAPSSRGSIHPPRKQLYKTNNKTNEHEEFFESLWKLYPRKKGKGQVSATQKKKLYKIGIDEIARTIDRYKREVEGKDQQYTMHGSTFFNTGYEDYLDVNYIEPEQPRTRGW